MSMAWASGYAVATLWNGVLLSYMGWQIITTGNVFIKASPAENLSTSDALFMLVGIGCSLACALHQLCPRRAGRKEA